MSLEVIKGGGQQSEVEDACQHLVDVLRNVISLIVNEQAQKAQEREGYTWGWLTVEEAAKKFEITPDAVRRRVREGRLPGRTYAGRVYVDLVEFDRVLRRRR
jgi:hypothetical protein